MLSKRIEYLLWILATDNTQLAAYAGCSESNFSRLKSGARQPSKESLTVKKFTGAVISVAKDKNMLSSLISLTGADSSDDDILSGALLEWLFSADDEAIAYSPKEINTRQFGEKLTLAMEYCSLSNSKLSRLANIDPSYISRMKSGTRMPKNNPELINRLCRIIAAKAFEKGSESGLFELTGSPEGDINELSSALFGWLYDKKNAEGALAVGRLIDKIAAIPRESATSPITENAQIDPPDTAGELYVGNDGLQSAVMRFLKNAAETESRQLLLYSDQPMDWMKGSFFPSWLALMKECISKNVKIKIIHNIDRMPAEMFDGISSWLPLYMTGLIEPLYSTARAGERFHTTIFLDRGKACVEGHFIRGMEAGARYRYITAPDELDYCLKGFELMLKDCRRLIDIKSGTAELSGSYRLISLEGIQLCIGEGEVIINKLTEPRMNFRFEHPLMIKAFKAFALGDK